MTTLISLNPPIVKKDNYEVTLHPEFEADLIWFIKVNDIQVGEKLWAKNGYHLGGFKEVINDK